MELFQPIEETRCGMFESKLAAEPKVSFERDDLTRQRLGTFSARENGAAVLQGMESAGQKREDWRSVTDGAVLNACGSNQ